MTSIATLFRKPPLSTYPEPSISNAALRVVFSTEAVCHQDDLCFLRALLRGEHQV